MTSLSMVSNSAGLVEALRSELVTASVIVDVGGGHGALASQILQDHQHLSAIVFDLV